MTDVDILIVGLLVAIIGKLFSIGDDLLVLSGKPVPKGNASLGAVAVLAGLTAVAVATGRLIVA